MYPRVWGIQNLFEGECGNFWEKGLSSFLKKIPKRRVLTPLS